MKKIKYFLMTLMLIAGAVSVNAEEGTHGVGFNLGYATGSGGVGNFGIGVKYTNHLSDNLRIQPSFTYYFEKDKFNMYDASVDFHYLFDISNDKLFFYPIFGFTVPFGHWDDPLEVDTDTHRWVRFGCNLGAGLQYQITDDFAIVGEAKYKLVKDYGNFNVALGCVVTF